MKPLELLQEVKAEFQVIYLEDSVLNGLLRRALGTYQDKAGPVKTISFPADETVLDRPADYLACAGAMDARGTWVEIVDSGTAEAPTLTALTGDSDVLPIQLRYFVDLRNNATNKTYELPTESIGLLHEYLFALIDIPNTRRERQISLTTGMQLELPGDEELRQRLVALELAMEESKAIIAGALVL